MTMNGQPAPATPTPAQTPPTPPPVEEARSTVDSRAAALKEKLDALPLEGEPSGSADEKPAAPPAQATSPADSAATPPDDAAAKAKAERLARIAQVRAKEQAAEEERAQKNRYKANEGEVEKLRKKLADLEPLNNVFASEEALLEAAEKKGLSAEKLVSWMKARLTDPALVAQRQAQTVEDKLRAELNETKSEIQKLREEMAANQRAMTEQQVARQKTDEFIQQVQARTDNPLVNAFLRKHGPERLINYANRHIAPDLPEEYTLDELFDHFEQHLDEIQVGGAPAAPAPPANGSSQTSAKNGAAKPPTTLSNSVASGRESLVESVPLHKLTKEERKRMLREKLDREP